MKKGDFIWVGLFLAFCAFLINAPTRELFIQFTDQYKLLGGFMKFAVLASMGELLAIRIGSGDWKFTSYFFARAVIWGIFGMLITMVFTIFSTGIGKLQAIHVLPFENIAWIRAFFISLFMNCLFAPTFMYAHRISDTFLDIKYDRKLSNLRATSESKVTRESEFSGITLSDIVKRIDMHNFLKVVVGKNIPFFWIPAHTIVFMLPESYRVLAAAMLSIALGMLLAAAKRSKTQEV